MGIKKALAVTAAVATLLLSSTTAFAHHGGGHHSYSRSSVSRSSTVNYPVCSVEGCDLTYGHYHDNCYYSGHYANDGHGYCHG